MGDCCENCGSENLLATTGCKATEFHPPEADGWECCDCGHWQVREKDYEYYEEDFI